MFGLREMRGYEERRDGKLTGMYYITIYSNGIAPYYLFHFLHSKHTIGNNDVSYTTRKHTT